jgi:DNA-binding NarL/FixJ family response regulator
MAMAVLIGTDLMFGSKILATGRAIGVEVATANSAGRLAHLMDAGGVRLVLVDMTLPLDEACAAIHRAAEHAPRPSVVAFYPHVQTALAEAAGSAGADLVMPRSKLNAELEAMLRHYCTDEPTS